MSELLLETDRSRVRRLHKRASYDRATAHALLDAQPMCSVGYILNERPYVTPTLQWRDGNRVFWHGSSASRVLRTAAMIEVCLSVAILDGFVMARSGYNHSVNSRSLSLFGTAEPVRDNEKRAALDTFVERLWPGRVVKLRPPTEQEIRATTVLSMEINEGSLKIRGGVPEDEDVGYLLQFQRSLNSGRANSTRQYQRQSAFSSATPRIKSAAFQPAYPMTRPLRGVSVGAK